MPDETPLDLAHLTLAAGDNLVGQDFVRPNPDGPNITLRLITAERVRRDPAVSDTTDRPFSLLFRGPANPRLTQGMHDLEHPRQPFTGLFLVPVGSDADGMLYEAVFA